MALAQLIIVNMAHRHPGLTRAVADNYFEAASVCLDRHHSSPIDFTVRNGETPVNAQVSWSDVDARTRDAWANESDATRDGAYACAIAAVELMNNMVAMRRAETLTGADYYIGNVGHSSDDIEGLQRLEVSGVDKGDETAIAQRLRQKVRQAALGKSNLPAVACVVGFRAAQIVMQFVEAG
jgi:hypothetical protein